MKKHIQLFFLFVLLSHSSKILGQGVFGKLVDEKGIAISNAWVSMFYREHKIATVLTTSEGDFLVENIPSGRYDFVVQMYKKNRTLQNVKVLSGTLFELMVDIEHTDVPTLEANRITDIGVDLNRFEWWDVPLADGFDYPTESGEVDYFYIARHFGEKNHNGEDWNGPGKGDADLGTPIHAVADGLVIFAGDLGGKWGNVVRVLHNVGTIEEPQLMETVYAHLLNMTDISVNELVVRGQQIGTMGNANGQYAAHLHFELRSKPGMPLGGGYGEEEGFLEPSNFIAANRSLKHRSLSYLIKY
jgi:hypothetical protein